MKHHTIAGGGGVRLHVVETGNPGGRPILFIHGFSQCWLAWSRQLNSDLAGRYRLVAMDMRGHGSSEKPRDGYADSKLWADDVNVVIQALELDHPVISGGKIMSSTQQLRRLFVASAIVLAWAASAIAADPFTLTSTTFKDGQLMPKKVANTSPTNANCVGENVSPQLSWTGVPDGTKSFAILMEDPEGRGGAGVHHWIAYGIPASVTSFAEGEVSKPSDKYVGGKSTQGVGNYSGPCTPPGSPHHYTFVVIATDLDPKELPPGLTREELQAKIVPPAPTPSHAKGTAGLVGMFVHPN